MNQNYAKWVHSNVYFWVKKQENRTKESNKVASDLFVIFYLFNENFKIQ